LTQLNLIEKINSFVQIGVGAALMKRRF